MRKVRSPLLVRWNSGLCLLESVHARDFRMPWTSQNFHKIIAPLHGEGRLETKDGGGELAHRIAPGAIALVGSGNSHRIQDATGSPLHLYILCIAKDFPISLPGSVAGVRVCRDSTIVQPGLLALREIAAIQDADTRSDEEKASKDLLRFGLTASLFARLFRAPKNSPETGEQASKRERIADFIRRLDTEFYFDRSLEDAAGETGMSRRRFTQLFAQFAGHTYAEYVQKLRIDHAKKLLEEQGRSPIAAAFECGYGDLSTFYRAFKRQTKMTPHKWARTFPAEECGALSRVRRYNA